MKAFEVFEKLMQRAIYYCMRYPSVRRTPDKYVGTPGELVTRLSEEERQALSDLKSEELSSDVVSKEQAMLNTSMTPRTDIQYGYDLLKVEKAKFDKRMKR